MSKNRLEKIASYDEQIAQLTNRKKQEMQKHKQDERKARTKRLIDRGAILESLIEEAATFSNDQIKTFLDKTITTDFAQRIMSEMRKQNTVTQAKAEIKTANPANGADANNSAVVTEQESQKNIPDLPTPDNQSNRQTTQNTPAANIQHNAPHIKNSGNHADGRTQPQNNKHSGGTGQNG